MNKTDLRQLSYRDDAGHQLVEWQSLDHWTQVQSFEELASFCPKRDEVSRLNNSRYKKLGSYVDVFDLKQSHDPDILGELNQLVVQQKDSAMEI